MPASLPRDWQELTQLTAGQAFVVERVRLAGKDIAIEGAFELPQLARLSAEDQVFVAAFLRSHGSIKEMEQVFGVSYPTVKARLNRIAGSLDFIETSPAPARGEVLDRLARGEITAEDAIKALETRGMSLVHAAPRALTAPRRRFTLRLWAPLSLLLWLLLLPLVVVLFPFVAVACLIYRLPPLALHWRVGALLFALSGTVVEIDAPDALIRIRIF